MQRYEAIQCVFDLRNGSAELGGHGMTAFGSDLVARVLQLNIRTRQIEHAAVGVVESCGQIRKQLPLQHQPHAIVSRSLP